MMDSAPLFATRTIEADPLTTFLYGGWVNYAMAAFGILMILYAIRVFVINKYLHPIDELNMIEDGVEEDDKTR